MLSTSLTIGAFTFEFLLMCLLWVVWVVLNLWIWQSAKSTGNALMMVGAAVFALAYLLFAVQDFPSRFTVVWLPLLGLVALTAGFYISIKPMVAARIAGLQSKLKAATSPPPGSSPPPPPPAAKS
jgi:hypothetical protein